MAQNSRPFELIAAPGYEPDSVIDYRSTDRYQTQFSASAPTPSGKPVAERIINSGDSAHEILRNLTAAADGGAGISMSDCTKFALAHGLRGLEDVRH